MAEVYEVFWWENGDPPREQHNLIYATRESADQKVAELKKDPSVWTAAVSPRFVFGGLDE